MGGSISSENRETVQMGAVFRLERMCAGVLPYLHLKATESNAHSNSLSVHCVVADRASAACHTYHAAH